MIVALLPGLGRDQVLEGPPGWRAGDSDFRWQGRDQRVQHDPSSGCPRAGALHGREDLLYGFPAFKLLFFALFKLAGRPHHRTWQPVGSAPHWQI